MKYKLAKIDLSQIEARLLNTVAGQWDVVEKFRKGEDVYSRQASAVFGYEVNKNDHPVERQVGKVLELQAGFGSGEDTIRRTIKLAGLPVNERINYRDAYRSTHRSVEKYWGTAGNMLWAMHDGRTVDWGCMTVYDHRIFHNDSGLWLDFTTLERYVPEGEISEQWRHRVRNGWRKTYGARVCQNIMELLGRLVISQAMVRVSQRYGLRIPLTVHDDLFVLIPIDRLDLFDKVVAEVSQQLTWLPECPIAVEAKLLDALDE